MTTIAEMQRRFESVKLREQMPIIIQSTDEELVTLNQQQLYYLGIDSDGNELKPYSFLTEFYKREKGQPFDRTTLKDTGAFYNGFFIRTDTNLITFDSTDGKTQELQEKYGTKIFGLTNENKTVYSFGIFYDEVKKYITEKTGVFFS